MPDEEIGWGRAFKVVVLWNLAIVVLFVVLVMVLPGSEAGNDCTIFGCSSPKSDLAFFAFLFGLPALAVSLLLGMGIVTVVRQLRLPRPLLATNGAAAAAVVISFVIFLGRATAGFRVPL